MLPLQACEPTQGAPRLIGRVGPNASRTPQEEFLGAVQVAVRPLALRHHHQGVGWIQDLTTHGREPHL